jgi:hypothetical protein
MARAARSVRLGSKGRTGDDGRPAGTARAARADPRPDLAAGHLVHGHEVPDSSRRGGGVRGFGRRGARPGRFAARIAVPRRTARICADAMAALGLLERDEPLYRNSPAADAFRSGRDQGSEVRAAARYWHYADQYWLSQTVQAALRPSACSSWNMSCICSTALAGRPGGPGVLAVIGADSAPGAHHGSGRLAAARRATAAIAAKRTMASVMFGVIKFFITQFLSYGLRSPQACLVVWAGLPGTYDAMDSDGGRRPPDR